MPSPLPVQRLRANRTAALGLPLLIYIALTLLLLGRARNWTTGFMGVGPDPLAYVWFLHWWPFAIAHGLNPFVTNYVWFPHGFNFAWAASVPFAALMMAPVTTLLGPVFSFNVLTLSAPVLGAWTMFLLCETITDDWLASLIGGYFYGFSSYELSQLLAHLNLDIICLVPLILLLCIRRVRGDMSGRVFIAGLAACLLAELGLSTEILATLCVFGALTWVVFFLCARKGEHVPMLRLAVEIVAAALITIILAAPFLYYLAKGFADVPAQINSAQDYVTDPRNFLIPTILTRFNRLYFLDVAQLFDGNASERGAYLGLPLILLVAIFFIGRIRRPYVLPLLVITVILTVCSLGPYLQTGPVPSQRALPWVLTQHVPLLHQLLASRFTMYIALCTAIAAALALTMARGWLRWANYGLAAAACASLLPAGNMLPWSPWPAAPFLTAPNIVAMLGKMPNVLVLPFADTGPGMAWQLDARMGFTQAGGYVGFVPAADAGYPAVAGLSAGDSSAAAINALEDFCVSHGVQYILLAPNTPPALASAILALRWPVQHETGVTIVKLPPYASLDYYALRGDYWASAAPVNWMGRKITITTRNAPLHLTLSGAWTRPSSTLRITVTDGTDISVYPIARDTVIPVTIPAHSAVTIAANEIWVPNKVTDPRQLSVTVELDGP
jgi:hypothetical protein